MSESIWALDAEGVPHAFSNVIYPDCDADIQWNSEPTPAPCHVLAATRSAAYAVDNEGLLYIYVKPSLIAIRYRITVYQNQRWYPVLGWGRTLPSDRAAITTEDGKPVDTEKLSLPSDGWRWEEQWTVHTDSLRDKEGWQYAFNFGSDRWQAESGRGCFVRRRVNKRYLRYSGVGKWVQLPCAESFISVTAGCQSVSECGLLFALARNGIIHRRVGISKTSPEGESWEALDHIISEAGEKEDVVWLVAAADLASLLVGTWDGRIYARNGITKERLSGTGWRGVATPQLQPATFAALGRNSLWVTTVDGQLWMARVELDVSRSRHEFSRLQAQSFVQMGTGLSKPSITDNDRLFCLSDNGETVYFREGISDNELSGKAFTALIPRTSKSDGHLWSAVVAAGCTVETMPAHWKSNSFRFRNDKLTSFKMAQWRNEILSLLGKVDSCSWEAFKRQMGDDELDDATSITGQEQDGWTRTGRVRAIWDGGPSANYRDSTLRLSEKVVFLECGRSRLQLSIHNLLLVEPTFDQHPFSFCIVLYFVSDIIRLSLPSEEQRDSWFTAIRSYHLRCLVSSPRSNRLHQAWSISIRAGNVRCHLLNELDVDSKGNTSIRPLDKVRSVVIRCHFRRISAGASRVVWTINKAGQPYTLAPEYNPLDENATNDYMQTDETRLEVIEYQRRAFLRGYVSFSGESNGVSAWMSGGSAVSGKYSRLPCGDWSWVDSEWLLEKDPEGWEYSIKAFGPYTATQSEGYFRRRRWHRRAAFASKGPWIKIDSPPLKSVHVQKQEAERLLVWAVTQRGEILLRQGVSAVRPQGTTWKQILCDYPVATFCVESPRVVWAATTKGKILHRTCLNQTDMECVDWTDTGLPSPTGGIHSMTVGVGIVWVVSNSTLAMISTTTNCLYSLRAVPSGSTVDVDRDGRVYVKEDIETVRQGEWVQRVVGKGKKTTVTSTCSSREVLPTGTVSSFSVV